MWPGGSHLTSVGCKVGTIHVLTATSAEHGHGLPRAVVLPGQGPVAGAGAVRWERELPSACSWLLPETESGRDVLVGSLRPDLCAVPGARTAQPRRDEGVSKSGCFRGSSVGGGNSSAPTRLRIAPNWVTLTRSSGHSLQPWSIISFLPDICPFRGGRWCGHIVRRSKAEGME